MSYTRAELIRAGQVLSDGSGPRSEQVWATETLGEWREQHGPLLEGFETRLRQQVIALDPGALLARRLKRNPSIVAKLRKMDSLKLPNMQDIGGVRAVVKDMATVYELDRQLREPGAPYLLGNRVDYISGPRDSGYRSLHLIYRNGPPPPGDGTFQLELQLRTRLQHAWATAVETVDAFQQFTLKSGTGPPEWQEYFFTVAGAFAYHEGCAPHPKLAEAGREATYRLAIGETRRLLVRERLRTYTTVMQHVATVADPDAYYLLRLYPRDRRTVTKTYRREHLPLASVELAMWEKRAQEGEPVLAVLVAAGTIENLRQAYPNYFMDTQEFVKILDLIEAEVEKPAIAG